MGLPPDRRKRIDAYAGATRDRPDSRLGYPGKG